MFMTTVAYLRWFDKADLGVQLKTGRGPMSYCRSCGWSVGLLHVSEPTACLEINTRYRPDNAIASGLGGMARSVGPPLQYRSAREYKPIWFAVSRTCYILAGRRIVHLLACLPRRTRTCRVKKRLAILCTSVGTLLITAKKHQRVSFGWPLPKVMSSTSHIPMGVGVPAYLLANFLMLQNSCPQTI